VLRIGAGSDGEADFRSLGCANCHQSGRAPLSQQIRRWTLTDIAASMWNHAPQMQAAGALPRRLAAGEMWELVSYLWHASSSKMRVTAAAAAMSSPKNIAASVIGKAQPPPHRISPPRVIRSRPPLWSQPCGATV